MLSSLLKGCARFVLSGMRCKAPGESVSVHRTNANNIQHKYDQSPVTRGAGYPSQALSFPMTAFLTEVIQVKHGKHRQKDMIQQSSEQ